MYTVLTCRQDLVKNHLMFAVREEIRSLKEEIEDLLTKNEQLESENKLLRSFATPETLAKLEGAVSRVTRAAHSSEQ